MRRSVRLGAHSSFTQVIPGSSLERALHLHSYHRWIPASPLQRCCGGCGFHRRELGFEKLSLTVRTYRTCEAATYISSIGPRFPWHATVPFGFRRSLPWRPRLRMSRTTRLRPHELLSLLCQLLAEVDAAYCLQCPGLVPAFLILLPLV
jgi:hypothetical protein